MAKFDDDDYEDDDDDDDNDSVLSVFIEYSSEAQSVFLRRYYNA